MSNIQESRKRLLELANKYQDMTQEEREAEPGREVLEEMMRLKNEIREAEHLIRWRD